MTKYGKKDKEDGELKIDYNFVEHFLKLLGELNINLMIIHSRLGKIQQHQHAPAPVPAPAPLPPPQGVSRVARGGQKVKKSKKVRVKKNKSKKKNMNKRK